MFFRVKPIYSIIATPKYCSEKLMVAYATVGHLRQEGNFHFQYFLYVTAFISYRSHPEILHHIMNS